jgi:hypothetical protein
MRTRVQIAYTVGLGAVIGGVVVGAIGLNDGNSNYCDFNTYCAPSWLGLVVAGSVLIWLGLAVTVAAYGRSRSRPFFPLLVAALSLGFPICLLALAVTSRLDVIEPLEPLSTELVRDTA